jgi:hypothetical protein
MQDPGSAPQPVIHEHTLHLPDDWTFHPEFRIAPVAWFGGIAHPFIRDTNPADETDPAIDNERFAMGAMIPRPEIPGTDLIKDFQLDPCFAEALPI